MTQLKRLSEEPGARGDWARDVLEQEHWPEPPPDTQKTVWRHLALTLPLGGPMPHVGPGGIDGLTDAVAGASGSTTEAAKGGAAAVLAKLGAVGTSGKVLAISVVAVGATVAGWQLTSEPSASSADGARTTPAVPLVVAVATSTMPNGTTLRDEAVAVGDSSPRDVSEAEADVPSSDVARPGAVVRGPQRQQDPASLPSSRRVVPHSAAEDASRGRLPDVVPDTPARPTPSEPTPPGSELLAESASLAAVRATLRQGSVAEASRRLAQHRARYPGGRLIQEREVLGIEILWRAGNRAAARQQLSEYAQRYPTSPHTPRLRRLMEIDQEAPNAK
jgi:hypothetical protein